MTKAGKQILQGLDEALRFVRGEEVDVRVWQVPVLDAAAVRDKTGLSQEQFARRFAINLATLRNWEQGVRAPEGPARVLLMVIDSEPEAVDRALKAWKPVQVDPKRGQPKKATQAKAERTRIKRKRA